MRVGISCAFFVVLLIAGLASQNLVPLSKVMGHKAVTSPAHLVELEQVSWFKTLKPTCSSKNPNLDDQYAKLKADLKAARAPGDVEKAKAAIYKFLNLCTVEPCPTTLQDLNIQLRVRSTNERLVDFFNTICKPLLTPDLERWKGMCSSYPEIISDLSDSIGWFSSIGQTDMAQFLKGNLQRIKDSNCRPQQLEFRDQPKALDYISYLLSRFKTKNLVEEEAQINLDRIVTLLNLRMVVLKANTCTQLTDTLKAIDGAANVLAGAFLERVNNMRDIIIFVCKVLPTLN